MKTKRITKRMVLFFLLIAVLMLVLLMRPDKTHYGISEGLYYMETEGEQTLTYIHFAMEDQTTHFVLGAENISFSYYGEVFLDGRVNAVAQNGDVWVFDIVDNNRKNSVKRSLLVSRQCFQTVRFSHGWIQGDHRYCGHFFLRPLAAYAESWYSKDTPEDR